MFSLYHLLDELEELVDMFYDGCRLCQSKYFEDIYKNSHINSQDNTNMQLDNQENKKIQKNSQI